MSRRKVINKVQIVEDSRGTVRCKRPEGCILEEFNGSDAWDKAIKWASETKDFVKSSKAKETP